MVYIIGYVENGQSLMSTSTLQSTITTGWFQKLLHISNTHQNRNFKATAQFSLRLIGSDMLSATFNLVTRVELP